MATLEAEPASDLKRSITGRLLFFYVLGDVLGSGIYVLIGSVAGAVGGAFWIAFALGVTVATFTGMAYAELVTKYPRAAGAALFIEKAFARPWLTFLGTVLMLSACFAAAGSLTTGFASYFAEVWSLPPALLVGLVFILLLGIVNFLGITESAVASFVMTLVEVTGLAIVLLVGIIAVVQGDADFGTLVSFSSEGTPVVAVVSGVALAFFAMTGFENAANVAEEVVEPEKNFPRALVLGMACAGVIYVLVAMAAALVVPVDELAASDAALLTVVESGLLPVSVGLVSVVFAVIAMIAISNTTLVSFVTQSRIMYGMAREDVVPGVFARVHRGRRTPVVGISFAAVVVSALIIAGTIISSVGVDFDVVARLATVTVVLTLALYALVMVSALKLRGQDESEHTYRAPTPLLWLGIVGNVVLLVYVVWDDPTSLIWCAALLGLGGALFLAQRLGRGSRTTV